MTVPPLVWPCLIFFSPFAQPQDFADPARKKDPLNEAQVDIVWSILAYLLRAILLLIALAIFSVFVKIK